MSNLFSNHAFSSPILRHKELPLYITHEFSFYRCVKFEDTLYEKTVSELHNGNLRPNDGKGRHSKLFPGKKISYWADSMETARAETKKHAPGNNLLTFWAYDDISSSFPTTLNEERLIIIDGLKFEFEKILDKVEKNIELSSNEKNILNRISFEDPDCLAYRSHTKKNSVNFLFFEKGFRKLAVKEVKLRLGDKKGNNSKSIVCAIMSDYSPILEAYGYFFSPLAKVGENIEYRLSDEYQQRKIAEEFYYNKRKMYNL